MRVMEGSVTEEIEMTSFIEAISAVADEGFLEEEDNDYKDLYNDFNVGEGFLQSLCKNEDLGFRNEDKKMESAAESTGLGVPWRWY